jgi:hypothetical protein
LKSAAAGGGDEMKSRIQHSTFNAQRPRCRPLRGVMEGWAWKVECPLLLFLPALPLCAQTATNALPALAPAYPELPPPFLEQHETAIIIGGFAFLALAFLFLKAMLRPESKVVLPPETVARQALAKLQPLHEDGKLLSEVSQVLRRYVAAAFELPAAEMTTAEFCAALAANEKIGAELAQTISNFLRECDERKFSTPPAASPLNGARRALDLIGLAESVRNQLDRQDACPTTG